MVFAHILEVQAGLLATILVMVLLGLWAVSVRLAFWPALRGALIGGSTALLALGAYYLVRQADRDELSFVGPAVHFSEPGLDGQIIDLAAYRGQLVLVQFWASWSPVCRGEVAQLRALWQRWGGRGLQIIGVSLDSERDAVEAFLEAEGIEWPQVFYPDRERRGLNHPIAQRFHAWTLPANALIDAEGRLLARDLRGPELLQTLEATLARQAKQAGLPWGGLGAIALVLAGLVLGSLSALLWHLSKHTREANSPQSVQATAAAAIQTTPTTRRSTAA